MNRMFDPGSDPILSGINNAGNRITLRKGWNYGTYSILQNGNAVVVNIDSLERAKSIYADSFKNCLEEKND